MEARSHIGRPRDTSVDARVLSAAFDLLKKVGFSEMTMDAVATAAGIDKPAIYRRWSSKEELAIAALSAGKPLLAIPDMGDTRAELVHLVRMLLKRRLAVETRVSPRLFDDSVSRPELRRLLWERLVAPRRQNLRMFLERGVSRGDLRPDLDLDIAPDVIIGTLTAVVRAAILSERGLKDSDALAESIADTLWHGLSAAPGKQQSVLK